MTILSFLTCALLSQEYDGSLDSVSVAGTASFNRRGSLLAVGCNDGRIVIWDFLTRGIAKIISAHVHPVTSVIWHVVIICIFQLESKWTQTAEWFK